MKRILLTDNNLGREDSCLRGRDEVAELFPIAGKTLAELCRENEHLLVFPPHIADAKDKIGKEKVFELANTDDPDRVKIVTGNTMGFIGIGDVQLKIQSRFDVGRDEQPFLQLGLPAPGMAKTFLSSV